MASTNNNHLGTPSIEPALATVRATVTVSGPRCPTREMYPEQVSAEVYNIARNLAGMLTVPLTARLEVDQVRVRDAIVEVLMDPIYRKAVLTDLTTLHSFVAAVKTAEAAQRAIDRMDVL